MPGVTKEQITKAKEWDLLSYLMAHEPQEVRKCGGNEYCTISHDSLKISNGKWNWHSRGIGGRTALDYLIKVRGMGFVDAVELLCGGRGAVCREDAPAGKNGEREMGQGKKPFRLPEMNRYGTAMVSYLQKRGIDTAVIAYCMGEGILFESRDYRNCVFVGRDGKGTAHYAALRGTGSGFVGEVEGSDKRYGFAIPSVAEYATHLLAAESPIDALSLATLRRQTGEDWRLRHYLSLGGTSPRALIQFLHDHPYVASVELCLDNDRAGRMGMEKIREAIAEDGALSRRIKEITDNPPPGSYGKDYNDLLRGKIAGLRREKHAGREMDR